MSGYLRTLLLFHKRHLRVQPLRELMAIAGVAAGVALLFAVQVARHSITDSYEEVAHGVAGQATLELAARGPTGFPASVAEEVQSTAGVKAAAPILAQPIVAVGPKGRRALTLVGSTELITSLHGSVSTAFERASEASHRGFLLLTQPTATAIGARTGSSVSVLIGGRTERMRVADVLASSTIGVAAESPIAAAPLAIVQTVAGLAGRASRVLIEPQRGSEAALRGRLARRFGAGADVRPIDTEAKLLGKVAAAESQVTLLFSVISLVAGVILAYNALLLASEERRRFIVYLSESGTPDSMVLASLAFDALVLGIAGCAIGLLAGELISLLAYRSVPGYITAAFAVGPQRVVRTQTVLIALAGGMFAAFAATALPAFAILRASAVVQLDAVGRMLSLTRRLGGAERGVFAAGAALVCGSAILATLVPASTVAALVGMTAGLVICLPLTARRLLELARWASRRVSDPAARLSVAELRSAPTRPVALLATGVVSAFLMAVIGGSVANVQSAVHTGASDLLSSASLWVKPGGPENVYTTEPFASAQVQQRLRRLGVVRSVLPWQDSFLDLPGRRVWVLGVPPRQPTQIAPSQLVDGSLRLADRRLRQGGWAAVSQTIARERHLRLGQRFALPTPGGPASFRLAATTANYGWLSGAVVLNADDHARLWGTKQGTQLAVTLKSDVPLDRAKRLVEEALPPGSSLAVQTAGQRRAEVSAVLASTLSRLDNILLVVLLTTIASVLALMTAAVWQSRARFNSLISIGMGYTQLARLIFYESGSMLVGGCAIGIAAGIVGQYLIDGWLHQTTGSPVRFSPAWQLGLRTAAVAILISLVASLIAAARAIRFRPGTTFAVEMRRT